MSTPPILKPPIDPSQIPPALAALLAPTAGESTPVFAGDETLGSQAFHTDKGMAPPAGASAKIALSNSPTTDAPTPEILSPSTPLPESLRPTLRPYKDENGDLAETAVGYGGETEPKPVLDKGGFLTRLGRIAGGFFGVTKPGSETPDSNLGGVIGNIAHRVGVGGAIAMGTPEQKQIAEEEQQIPLKVAQIQNERAWRAGMLGINQQKANTGQQNADTKTDVANLATIPTAQAKESNLEADTILKQQAAQGFFPVSPGLATALGMPDQAGQVKSKAWWDAANKKLQAVGSEIKDLGPEGTWTVSKNTGEKLMQISAYSQNWENAKTAQDRVRIASQAGFVPVNDAVGNTTGWVNPRTGARVSVADINGLPEMTGGAVGPTGAPVIPQKPTGQMRNVGAQATQAVEGIPQVLAEIDQLGDQLGPVMGRWNDFTQGKMALDNPEFAGFRADLLMLSSAVALAHARGRLPENLREEFDTMMNAPQQTPDNLKSVLTHILPWMQRASQIGIPQNTNAPQAAPQQPPARATLGTQSAANTSAQTPEDRFRAAFKFKDGSSIVGPMAQAANGNILAMDGKTHAWQDTGVPYASLK